MSTPAPAWPEVGVWAKGWYVDGDLEVSVISRVTPNNAFHYIRVASDNRVRFGVAKAAEWQYRGWRKASGNEVTLPFAAIGTLCQMLGATLEHCVETSGDIDNA